MRIIGPDLNREHDVDNILRSLPKWFGIEESIQMYVRDSKTLPGFAVESGLKLAGFISLIQHFPKAWEVHCIAVSANERNSGLGTVLLNQAESWLAEQGAQYLQIKTIADTSSDPNYAETREFYLNRGYEPMEVFPTLWGPTNPALQLVKVLKNI
jgi:GNAT superfamily N-acetyltransferase